MGEIRKGGNGIHRQVWLACRNCGRERWVELHSGRPLPELCPKCSCNARNSGRKGAQAYHWKGGQIKHNGYILIRMPGHPRAFYGGYVKRARLVLENKLGRALLPGMVGHHCNGIRDDDRPENLVEILASRHSALHRSRLKEVVSSD